MGFSEKQFIRGEGESSENIPSTLPTAEQSSEESYPFLAQLEQKMSELQRLIDSHRRLFSSFAEDSSVKFVVSDGFYFLPETGEIHIDTKWFFQEGYTKEQIIWACYHELSHFRDMLQDPKGFLENFKKMQQDARRLGRLVENKWREKYAQDDPEFIAQITKQRPIDPRKPNGETMNMIESSMYRTIHGFWNAMDDIYVNNDIRRRATRYQSDSSADHEIVQSLYRNKLFVGNDYSDKPKNLQLIYKLLREEMVPDEKVVVDSDVEQQISKSFRRLGKSMTLDDILRQYVRPQKGQDTSPSTRYRILRDTVWRRFEELLRQDIEDAVYEKPEKPLQEKSSSDAQNGDRDNEGENQEQEGGQQGTETDDQQESGAQNGEDGEQSNDSDNGETGNDSKSNQQIQDSNKPSKPTEQSHDGSGNTKGEYQEFNPVPFAQSAPDRTPDQFSEQDINDFLDFAQKIHEERERYESMTDQEKRQYQRELKQKSWDKRHNIAPQERREFNKIVQSIAPYLDSMGELWRSIAYGETRELDIREIGHYCRGRLDVDEVINKYPDIQHAKTTGDIRPPEVYKRPDMTEVHVLKPEIIRVRLALDLSGSMNSAKRLTLKKSATLLLLSLKEFNEYLDLARKKTKAKLRVETEVWVFGSSFNRIKGAQQSYDLEQADIIHAISAIDTDLGTTDDAAVLQGIYNTITPQDRQMLRNEKLMDMVIEITDGKPNDTKQTRNSVDQLVQDQLITRGIQIGQVSDSEQKAFNQVWNDNRAQPLGTAIGTNLPKLPEALMEILKEYLGDVQI